MEQLCHGSGGVFPVDEYPLGGTEGLHRPVKFPGGELLYGRLQVRPLPLQPGLWRKTRSLTECGRQLYRRAGRLLQHQRFQRLEVPAAHMAGKPGDRGVGDLQPLGQLPDGGEQEGGFRAGTLAVHDIVGFGKAAEIALRDLHETEQRIKNMDHMLVEKLKSIPFISLTNPSEKRLPGIISIIIAKNDFNNERFIKHISDKLALSTGSACSAGEPSYVINAIGLENQVSKVLRISLNKYTKEEELDQLVDIFKNEV